MWISSPSGKWWDDLVAHSSWGRREVGIRRYFGWIYDPCRTWRGSNFSVSGSPGRSSTGFVDWFGRFEGRWIVCAWGDLWGTLGSC